MSLNENMRCRAVVVSLFFFARPSLLHCSSGAFIVAVVLVSASAIFDAIAVACAGDL